MIQAIAYIFTSQSYKYPNSSRIKKKYCDVISRSTLSKGDRKCASRSQSLYSAIDKQDQVTPVYKDLLISQQDKLMP